MSSLYVGNLSSHVRHQELENAFRRYGRCNLELKDGFGFVIYDDHRDADGALKALQGRSICGEHPSISWAKNSRPFQRNFGKGNFTRRDSWDKYQNQGTRRRGSLDTDRRLGDGRREDKLVDEVKDGSRASHTREDAAQNEGRGGEWKDSGPEKLGSKEEMNDVDPLDSARWDPHMEGSPENMMADGVVEDEEHPLDDKDKEEERGGVLEKSQGSPHERSSRGYYNSSDQYRRGRNTGIQRHQERCYNCGKFGHVKWQCRSRPRNIGMHSRDGGYDGWRNDSRYFGGRGGFRGIGGGRFRGINGSRRMLSRDMEGSYGQRSSRRHDMSRERCYDPVDKKSREKSKRRQHRSESPKDSSSRHKIKRKHKKTSKKSSNSTRKRQRSSSASPPSSKSGGRTSSSSPSGSRSCSRSGSRSAASRSRSSRSGSQSSSSISRSQSSQSQAPTSHSASSLSRSHSASSHSRMSASKSRSRSPLSSSPGHSRSPRSHGILGSSPKAVRTNSPLGSNSEGGSRSSKPEEEILATSSLQGKQVSKRGVDDNNEKGHGSDSLEGNHHEVRRERRRQWAREVKKQKNDNRSDSEEPHFEAEIQSNGRKRVLKCNKSNDAQGTAQQGADGHETLSRGPCTTQKVDLKSFEPCTHSRIADMQDGVEVGGCGSGQGSIMSSFGAARLWAWEAMLQRRRKRGPISIANYEKRKAQNDEFGIQDMFVRSSSGWWEKHTE